METTSQSEYHIRDLGTRCVTLFPARALVVRDIKDVTLKPGANQITVVGLSPTVDEQSIKVEGTGSAIITDIAVELLPNRDIFRDFYPDLDSDDSSDEDSAAETDDGDEAGEHAEAIEAVRDKLAVARDEEKRGRELVISAENQANFLNQFANRVSQGQGQGPSSDEKGKGSETSPIAESIAPSLDTYRAERANAFEDYMNGLSRQREALKSITKLEKEESRLLKQAVKRKSADAKKKAKELKSKQKEKAKAARQKRERANEKARKRRERALFWPRKVYTLKISLDAGDQDETESAGGTCDLSLSYMTAFAFWAPAYDLVVSTTENTGHLCFDAMLTNETSETWSGCKVVLSTSHADSSNLDEEIPELKPWRVTMAQKGGFHFSGDATYSPEERVSREARFASQRPSFPSKARWEMFGVEPHQFTPKPSMVGGLSGGGPAQAQGGIGSSANPPWATNTVAAKPSSSLFGQPASGGFGQPASSAFGATNPGTSQAFGGSAPGGGGLFGGRPAPSGQTGGGLFGGLSSSSGGQAPQNTGGSLFGGASQAPAAGGLFGQPRQSVWKDDAPPSGRPREEAGGPEPPNAATMPEPQPELTFAESAFEETGFTTTYDLAGLKTLGPSSTASKQRVARISFPDVIFKHKVVAKHKAAAYLGVRLRNSDQTTLLKARTGLTLDGTFMGRTILPRCSPGEWFSMNLGVDPAIDVTYPKPDVKHSQIGLAVFNKENSDVYTRAVTLSNKRSGPDSVPVKITVLDQVPLSEDERLRVVVLQPKGLEHGGSGVRTGVSVSEEDEGKAWGHAVATLKDDGEVSWDVSLNAGCKVKLPLEYQCALPSGCHVVNV